MISHVFSPAAISSAICLLADRSNSLAGDTNQMETPVRAGLGLTIIGVSVDEAGLKTVKAFARTNGINYPVVLTDSKIVEAYGGIDGLPTTFIIDRSGHIVKQHPGFTGQAEIEKEVALLLAQ